MKQLRMVLASVLLTILSTGAFAQSATIQYTDASIFPLYGKCVENTSARYERLPAEYKEISRPEVWNLGRNSAGLYIRFRTDSKSIFAKWRPTFKKSMNHMTDTGTRGLDLYILDGKEWRFCGSGRPTSADVVTAPLIRNLDGEMHEYILYLSLYDGVSALEIGTEEGSAIKAPAVRFPLEDKKIVMYGTSILQGGCASRPGMAFTAMIGRRTGREVINLGFSGNGKLDYEIAQLMIKVENPGVFVLDYVPNCVARMIDEKGEHFFRIIRDAFPTVPIVFLEDPIYPTSHYDSSIHKDVESRNQAQRNLFDSLKKSGEKNIYFVPSDKLIGTDGEATVDGVHFTDLGMMRYSDILVPVLKNVLK